MDREKAEDIISSIQIGSLENFKYLFSGEFDFNTILSQNRGSLPIHIAADYGRLDIIEFLLDNGINVNKTDNCGCTPLHYAVIRGHLAVINRLIVEMEGNFNKAYKDGGTILHFACAVASYETVSLFLNALEKVPESERNLNKVDIWGHTPLHMACLSGNDEVVHLLLNALEKIPESDRKLGSVNSYGNTPLHFACERRDEAVVSLLLNALEKIPESERNLSMGDRFGDTPLHTACSSANEAVIGLILNALEKIHVTGRNLSIENRFGETPLHIACERGNDVVVGLLLNALEKVPEMERNLNTVNNRGNTPLNYLTNELARNFNNKCNIINVLINYGAYFNSKDIVRIVDYHSARNILFTDSKLCAQSCLNHLVNDIIPSLYDSPLSARLPPRERLMSVYLRNLENLLKVEIRNNGYCDLRKLICPLYHLSIVCLSNYCKTYYIM